MVSPVLVVAPNAFKHGLTEEQIVQAWNNAIYKQERLSQDEYLDYVAIGFDSSGIVIELVAAKKEYGWYIYHANTPPTKNVLQELGLI